MPEPQSRPTWRSFDPSELGEQIRYLRDSERRQHFVTFLVGSGFSVTAGVPSAATIIKELRENKDGNPRLRNPGPPRAGISDYAFLMDKLGSPAERARYVKDFVGRAKDSET